MDESDVAMTALPATLTLRDAPAVLETLRGAFALSQGDVWRIDAAPVTQLDTSALAVLLECARIAVAGGRRLEITGVPPRLEELARLYGVEELLGIEPEVGVATASPLSPGRRS
jgi:phospholipid transport system transporter-binding protein